MRVTYPEPAPPKASNSVARYSACLHTPLIHHTRSMHRALPCGHLRGVATPRSSRLVYEIPCNTALQPVPEPASRPPTRGVRLPTKLPTLARLLQRHSLSRLMWTPLWSRHLQPGRCRRVHTVSGRHLRRTRPSAASRGQSWGRTIGALGAVGAGPRPCFAVGHTLAVALAVAAGQAYPAGQVPLHTEDVRPGTAP